MKHFLALVMMFSFVTSAHATEKVSECAERQAKLFAKADAITVYNTQFTQFLRTVKKADQNAVAAKHQEEFNNRVQELEQAHEKFVADCVQ